MSIHEERMAVLTTAHVPSTEAQLIGEMITSGDLIGMQREEGWLIHTRPSNASECLPSLTYALGYLASQGFVWVLFDRDASGTDELEVFDW